MAYDAHGLKMYDDGGAIGTAPGNVKCLYHYATNDSAPTVEAANYFDTEIAKLGVGDAMDVVGSVSGTPWMKRYVVTSVTTHVTIRAAGAGLWATASLDFPNTNAQLSAELTIAVPGAIVGDPVALGLPAAPDANCCYTAYVSAADVVTVRLNNYSSGAINPAAANFTVNVLKAS